MIEILISRLKAMPLTYVFHSTVRKRLADIDP